MNLWAQNGNRLVALSPGPDDMFTVTMLGGEVVFFQPITEFEKAVNLARAFLDEIQRPRPITIKVLALSVPEACKLLGITPDKLFSDMSPEKEAEMRQIGIDACKDALRTSQDPQVRADALQILRHWQVLQ